MTHGIIPIVTARDSCITKVTFTVVWGGPSIHFVVWQFWGRAAEASLTEKSRALFYCVLETPTVSTPAQSSWVFFTPSESLPGAESKAILRIAGAKTRLRYPAKWKV